MVYRLLILLLAALIAALLLSGKLGAGLRIIGLIALAAAIAVLAVVVLNLPRSPY